MELDLLRPCCALETFTPARIARLKKEFKARAISVSLHVPYTINLGQGISLLRAQAVDYVKQVLVLGRQLEVTHVTLHIGNCHGRRTDRSAYEDAFARIIDSLRRVVVAAERYKVDIALENSNPLPPDSGFLAIGQNITELKRIFKAIRSPYLGFCLDVGHAQVSGGVPAFIRAFFPLIKAVHCHDNRGKMDEHLDIGCGAIPWKTIFPVLVRRGFLGPYVSETFRKLKPHQTRQRLLALL